MHSKKFLLATSCPSFHTYQHGFHWNEVCRDISVGKATRYGVDGPGIESLPIPVAGRSKSRICGRSLAGVEGSNRIQVAVRSRA